MNKTLLILTYCLMLGTTLLFIFFFILAYLSEGKAITIFFNAFKEANLELIMALIIIFLIIITFKDFLSIFSRI
jgi:hypothetical protein